MVGIFLIKIYRKYLFIKFREKRFQNHFIFKMYPMIKILYYNSYIACILTFVMYTFVMYTFVMYTFVMTKYKLIPKQCHCCQCMPSLYPCHKLHLALRLKNASENRTFPHCSFQYMAIVSFCFVIVGNHTNVIGL